MKILWDFLIYFSFSSGPDPANLGPPDFNSRLYWPSNLLILFLITYKFCIFWLLILEPTLLYTQTLGGDVTPFKCGLFLAQLFLELLGINCMRDWFYCSFALVASNSSARMKSSSTSMAKAKMKHSSLKSEGLTFQFFNTCILLSNNSARMKPSSSSIDRARVKSSSSKNKDKTF